MRRAITFTLKSERARTPWTHFCSFQRVNGPKKELCTPGSRFGLETFFMNTITSEFQEAQHLVKKYENFPRPGVNYYDLTPLLRDALFFGRAMERFARVYSKKRID